MQHRTGRIAVLAVLGLSLGLAGCGGSDSAGSKASDTTSATTAATDGGTDAGNEILVGLLDEQTGPTAAVQSAAGDGVRLAVDELNAKGGIDGRKIRLVTKDTGGDAAQSIRGVKEMDAEGVVAVVGPVSGGMCAAVNGTYTELKLPGFCLSPLDLPAESPYMFGIGVELAQEDEQVFDFLGAENGKVGILAQKTAVLDTINAHVKAYASDLDVQIEQVETTDTSARAQMQNLIDAGVGGILLAPCGPLTATAAKEAIDLGFKGKIFVWNCFASENAAKSFASITNGQIYTVAPTFILDNAADDDPQLPQIEAYEAAGGKKDIVEAVGWDGMMVLAQVIEAGGADRESIMKTLEAGLSYDGVWSAGKITADDHRGARAEGAMQLVKFTPEGTMELVKAP